MRGPFRYISVDKLNAMSNTNRWWRRTTLKVRASLPGVASADATVAPASADWPARIGQVEGALRKSKRVVSAHDIVSSRNGMFEFVGPAKIMAAADAFWVATATEGVAVLLVGSLKHVVGATPPQTSPPLSPSIDPTPAVRSFVTGQHLREHTHAIERAWIGILSGDDIGELQPLQGIAEYRAQDELPGGPYVNGHPLENLVEVDAPLVLGSPLWVEAT